MAQEGPFRISEPYSPRSIRFREVREHRGWRIKVYGIRYGDAPLDWPVYEEGLQLVFDLLPEPAVTADRPGVGFSLAHQGRGVHYLTVNWWDLENELFTQVRVCGFGAGQAWREPTPGEYACVWDLQVIAFERDAYVECVLARPEDPDLEGYLARHFAT